MSLNKKEYLIAAALAVLLAVIIIAVNVIPEKKPERLIAKVRYFDGSMDTIEIRDYDTFDGFVKLTALDGHYTILGSNNVIIVQDDDY